MSLIRFIFHQGDYRPNPFALGRDSGDTSQNPKFDETTLSRLLLNPKRPYNRRTPGARISSWADPVSARDLDSEVIDDDADDSGSNTLHHSRVPTITPGTARNRDRRHAGPIYEDDGEEESDTSQVGWKKREKTRFHSLLSVVDGDGQRIERNLDESEYTDEEDEEDEEVLEQRRRRSAKFEPKR